MMEKKIEDKSSSNNSNIYLKNRACHRLAALGERGRDKGVVYNQSLTKDFVLDNFITHYFENTQKVTGWRINFDLFKQIAFGSGVPLLIVDLFSHLTG